MAKMAKKKKARKNSISLKDLQADIDEAEALISRATTLANALDEIESELDDIQMDIQGLNTRLSTSMDAVQNSIIEKKQERRARKRR